VTVRFTVPREAPDLNVHLDESVYPTLFQRLDQAFPEFDWCKHGDAWQARRWPADRATEAAVAAPPAGRNGKGGVP